MDERIDSFGTWLRRRRKALDLTQGALAARVSCSPAAIRKIEAQERRPSRALAQRLAEHLGIAPPERDAFLRAARDPGVLALPTAAGAASHAGVAAAGEAPAGVAAVLAPWHEGGAASPFVGRAEHLAVLASLLDRAHGGGGHVALLQGEAGIGKSRLLQETLALAQRRGLPVLGTNCYEIERSIAYQPVIELATQACSAAPQARLQQVAPVLLAEIAALVPAVAGRVRDLPALSPDFPEARQARLFQALAQLFDALADGRALFIAVDNLQWADDASLRFLHFYARQARARPVLLACALRDDEPDANPQLGTLVASLRADAHVRQLALPRLSLADVEALLERAEGVLPAGSGRASHLLRESEGNPFFLWSLLHALGERTEAGAGRTGAALPQDLRDSVRARLARVPREDLQLLEMAAVLGRRFHFETLLSLCRMPADAFLAALDALARRRLLRAEPEGGFYDFSHDKVREVVYQDLGAARRVLLHRQAAQLLEQDARAGAHERYGHLAEHYERGEVWPQAFHWFSRGAERSLQLFAIRESLQWFDRAVSLLQEHPDAASASQQLLLYERRGAARAEAGQTEGAVADFQRVIQAARSAGEQERARDVLIRLGMAYRRADRYHEAIACLEEALAASRATGDERHVADSLYHLGTVAWSNGRNDLAVAYHQEAVEICERLRLADLVAVQAFHGRGEAWFAQAQPAAAIDCFARSLELARAIGDRSYESENLMMIGWACIGAMGLGEDARALQHFDAALAIARAADLRWHLGPTLIGRAHALAALARRDAARADLQEVLPQLEALGLVRYQVMAHDALGTLLLDEDRPTGAAQHFERALLLAEGAGIRYWVARVTAGRVLAQVRAARRADRAGLLAALGEAQEHQEHWLVPRCLEALAEAALAEGEPQAARDHAAEALALAESGGLRTLAARASALRQRASGAPAGALGQSAA